MLDSDLGAAEPVQRNLELLIEYSGASFCGWQVQSNQRTAMGEIERAIAEITQSAVRVVAASRTDAGVHALGQVCSFKSTTQIPARKLCRGLNAKLPDDIVVRRVRDVPPAFHARFSSRGKHYRYQILNRSTRSPTLASTTWHQPTPLDVEAMQAAARYMEGEHDFSALATRRATDDTCVRRLFAVRVRRAPSRTGPDEVVTIDVVGDAFLYKMVRTIVGTLTLVGQGKHHPGWVEAALHAKTRDQAGPAAPAQGLFLVRVFYERDELDAETVERYLEGIGREHNDHRPQHAGPRQRQGVRRGEGPEARALLGVSSED